MTEPRHESIETIETIELNNGNYLSYTINGNVIKLHLLYSERTRIQPKYKSYIFICDRRNIPANIINIDTLYMSIVDKDINIDLEYMIDSVKMSLIKDGDLIQYIYFTECSLRLFDFNFFKNRKVHNNMSPIAAKPGPVYPAVVTKETGVNLHKGRSLSANNISPYIEHRQIFFEKEEYALSDLENLSPPESPVTSIHMSQMRRMQNRMRHRMHTQMHPQTHTQMHPQLHDHYSEVINSDNIVYESTRMFNRQQHLKQHIDHRISTVPSDLDAEANLTDLADLTDPDDIYRELFRRDRHN